MKKIEREFVRRWHNTLDDTEKFLDFAEHSNINSFRVDNGVREVLFENGNTYSVDTVMRETDGELEREIIETLAECGVEFKGEELKEIKKAIENECVSQSEIAWLTSHKQEVLDTGDIVLCEWAGISEQEYNAGKLLPREVELGDCKLPDSFYDAVYEWLQDNYGQELEHYPQAYGLEIRVRDIDWREL